MVASAIYAIGGFIELLVGLRFVLRLLGANPASGFVEWVYTWSTPFVAPFAGIFGQDPVLTGQGVVATSVFDWAALIAFVVVAAVTSLLARVAMPARRHA